MKVSKQLQKGFSLMEIMIVVAIIGIVAAIALPAYADHVRRGKAAEATANLAEQKIRMEQNFQDNRTYACGAAAGEMGLPPAAEQKFFSYTCVNDASTFTLTATGVADQDMSGYVFSITESNVKNSTIDGVDKTGCWGTSKDADC